MKKFWLTVLTAGISGMAVMVSEAVAQANGPLPAPSADQKAMTEWTPIQFGFTYTFPSSTYNSNVYGLKTGWPITAGVGRVCGLEVSWFVAATDYVRGLQAALFYTQNNQLQGVQASLGCNISKAGFLGLQSSPGYNYSDNFLGVQGGVVNTARNYGGLQAAIVTNVADDAGGVQASLVVNVSKKIAGLQAGLVNHAGAVNGVQAGLINMSESGGFQFGLINYIKDAPIPVLPFVNFRF